MAKFLNCARVAGKGNPRPPSKFMDLYSYRPENFVPAYLRFGPFDRTHDPRCGTVRSILGFLPGRLATLSQSLVHSTSVDQIIELENIVSKKRDDRIFNERFASDLYDFVLRTVTSSNRRVAVTDDHNWKDFFRPPPFLWSFPRRPSYDYQKPIRSISSTFLRSSTEKNTPYSDEN
jgi:hypothetical protein